MKYKLISKNNPKLKPIEQVLINRGIPYTELQSYLNTTDDDINSPLLLGEENLMAAATAIITAINNNQKAKIIVDSDCDGYTSSAILLNYLYELFPSWIENNVEWVLHNGKEHGLNDMPLAEWLQEEIKLVICPDSSSEDYDEHKFLKDHGITTIVLDHHEAKMISPNAIVINNQLSDYPNKDFSGAGIVWQFCRFLDSKLNVKNADTQLDLVALGVDADMMSLKSKETKHIINKGFEDQYLKNPFVAGIAWKNSFLLGQKITPIGAAFYIAPLVNAMVRSGTPEEKKILFKSMLKFEAFKEVPSIKRGHKPGDMEKIIDQALRTVTNVKNRQTKAQDAGMQLLEEKIEKDNLLNHKVLLFLLEPNQIDKNIAGLCANKIMAKYQRPCCILTKFQIETEQTVEDLPFDLTETVSQTIYQGSARGCDKTGVYTFKDICESTGAVDFVKGHQGAFGLGICEDELQNFISKTDNILKDVSDEAIYNVDFVFENIEVNPDIILEIADFDDLWGKDVDEPYVAVRNLKVTKNMVTFMKGTTIKITLPNKVSLIKFNSTEEEYQQLISEGYVLVDIVGKCNKNEWAGETYAQIKIEDFSVNSVAKYDF